MKPLRVMSIHKSVYVTSFNDVLTEARGNIYADSTLISYKAVQNKKRLSKKSTFCDDMLFTHRFQGNITS